MAISSDLGIMELDYIVSGLAREDRSLFERIFHVTTTYGRIVPPESMVPWIERQFGSVQVTLEQKIVKVTNIVTLEGVLFNCLRSSRPMWHSTVSLEEELERKDQDPISEPLKLTPEDVFGRVRGKHSITASNVAKFDGYHGLVIFDEGHPLRFTREAVHDYIDTGWRWAELAHIADPSARYYLFMWNCLWRAGASLLHGHSQVLLGRDMHYAKVESLRRDALLYSAQYRSNYFNDLYQAHEMVGCGFEKEGVRIIANLAPIKEHEVVLLSPALDDSLKDRIFEVLSCYRDALGVSAFNLVIYMPPMGEHGDENWEGFPVMVRIVDRGDPTNRTNDFGAMELYAASVVSSDPLALARTLEETMG